MADGAILFFCERPRSQTQEDQGFALLSTCVAVGLYVLGPVRSVPKPCTGRLFCQRKNNAIVVSQFLDGYIIIIIRISTHNR